MIPACIREGFATIRKQRRLTLLLWFYTLCLASWTTIPLYLWWKKALGKSPDADRILNGFHFQILAELTAFDLNSLWQMASHYSGLLLLLTLLSSIFLSGGTIQILAERESGLTMSRFTAGAGRYFWRFLRLFLVWGVGAALCLGVALAAGLQLFSRFQDAGWETATFSTAIFLVLFLLLLLGVFLIVLDYARIRIVLDRDRHVVACLFSSIRLVWSRTPTVLVPAIVFGGLAFAAWIGGYTVSVLADMRSLTGILSMALFHQLLQLVRSAMRIGMLGAEMDFLRKNRLSA